MELIKMNLVLGLILTFSGTAFGEISEKCKVFGNEPREVLLQANKNMQDIFEENRKFNFELSRECVAEAIIDATNDGEDKANFISQLPDRGIKKELLTAGNTPAHLAMQTGPNYLRFIESFYKKGANLNAVNLEGYSVLNLAVFKCFGKFKNLQERQEALDVVKFLLDVGVVYREANALTKISDLYRAVRARDIEVIKLILEHTKKPININALDWDRKQSLIDLVNSEIQRLDFEMYDRSRKNWDSLRAQISAPYKEKIAALNKIGDFLKSLGAKSANEILPPSESEPLVTLVGGVSSLPAQ